MSLLQKKLGEFKHPHDVQRFLDEEIRYNSDTNPEVDYKSPRRVIETGTAHCVEGAIFAAAALENMGYKPLIIEMIALKNKDDDHFLAVFKKNMHWGAISKSNFNTLTYREPVYRSLREIVMSHFDYYFNTKGRKTLRRYSAPLNLKRFEKDNWKETEKDLVFIVDALNQVRHYELLTRTMIRDLQQA